MDDAVGGGLVDSILRSADGIWNDSPLGQDSGTSINWAGDWDSWWESETGSQSDDLYLKASSDAFTIAALALPVADAVDGAADAIRGSDLLADLFRASEGGDSWITRLLAPNITAHAATDAPDAAVDDGASGDGYGPFWRRGNPRSQTVQNLQDTVNSGTLKGRPSSIFWSREGIVQAARGPMPENAAPGSFEFTTPVEPFPYANTVPGEAWWPASWPGVGSEDDGDTAVIPVQILRAVWGPEE
jgi:hypothetical protein